MTIKDNPTSFRLPEGVREPMVEAAITIAADFHEIAQAETSRLMEISGLPEQQVASIIAKAMVTSAWVLASNAQRKAGNTPIPERFLTVAREIVGFSDNVRTRVKLPAIEALLSTGKLEDYDKASALIAALSVEELQSYAKKLHGGQLDQDEQLKALFEWKGPGESPHNYSPDHEAMGDCRICGHTYEAHFEKGK